jgi:hypothetical protein
MTALQCGVFSGSLIIARLPAASAVAKGPSDRYSGMFQGATMPTTPLG